MEYRKLISFGKSSYIVSLPKSWVEKHNLKQGDLLSVEEKQETIILQPKLPSEISDEVQKKKFIDTDNKDIDILEREILAAYVNGAKSIILMGKDVRHNRDALTKILHGMMALEIVEQTPEKMVVHDFVDMREIEVRQLIRKIDITIRAFLEESVECLDKNNLPSVEARHGDIVRFTYLGYRVVKFALRNPSWTLKIHGIDNITIANTWVFFMNLENIAKEILELTRLFVLVENKKHAEQIKAVCGKINEQYREFMKAYYNNELYVAVEASKRKRQILQDVEQFLSYNQPLITRIAEHTRLLTNAVHELGRATFEKDES